MTTRADRPEHETFSAIKGLELGRPAEHNLGGLQPKFALRPITLGALRDALAQCDAANLAAVCFGGGTLQGTALPPRRFDVALDLTALNRVLAYDARDLTISIEAGIRVSDLDRTLAAAGQFLPLDAPRATYATVGGTLAGGWLGPRRHRYGRARDFLIGSTVVLADGTVAHAGGTVVKNVSGYDMGKLYIGSHGTLAAIAAANFKTLPLPQARRLAVAALPERTFAHALANMELISSQPAALLHVSGYAREIDSAYGADGRLALLLEGSRVTVDRATRDLRTALGAAGVPETIVVDRTAASAFEQFVDAFLAVRGDRSATFRLALPEGNPLRAIESVRGAIAECDVEFEAITDLCNRDITVRCSARSAGALGTAAGEVAAALRRIDPKTRILALPHPLRGRVDPWGAPPPALALMKRIKAAFDPRDTLAPGRFVGRL